MGKRQTIRQRQKRGIGRILPWVRNRSSEDEETAAFRTLAGKFAKIEYLMQQRALFDVAEKAPVGICITNQNYLYEYINPAYCRIYGYRYEELIGKPFTVVVPEDHRKELTELHDRFMNQEYELEGEWEVVRKDGKRLTILANAAYVVDEQLQPKKITFVLDRTRERRALKRMEEIRARASSAREVLREMTSSPNEADMTESAKKLAQLLEGIVATASGSGSSPASVEPESGSGE